ncbi:hypothetical protein CRE_09286 [Caenorhabditis remanei]|uniref:DUF7869 domain-containing protein n=1 Tax=Caenorhabditis remanei TaxID=31234 RepID=E3LHZ9_CAERE|nr:hypothetical protein CRE_09286 [Caenorhabditis remanei]
MNVNLRERKSDTLTRCSVCTSLREIMRSGDSEDLRNKSKKDLEAHYSYISQQRIIMETLSKQSRDPDSDVLVILSDSMSNKYSKLPILLSRPKNISDAIRVPMSLTTFQFALQNGTHMFTNFDYVLHQTLYKHDGSFTFSLLLDALTKAKELPSTLVLIMDSARPNKCFTMFGCLGLLLSKVTTLQRVFVLFPQVGHTHLSVDSHFGTVSSHLKETDVYDPKGEDNNKKLLKQYCSELSETLKMIPSVFDVVSDPTIFDFSRLNEEVNKTPGLCSTNQIVISRAADGNDSDGFNIYISSAPSISSSILFETSSKEKATKLFKVTISCLNTFIIAIQDTFDPLKFFPTFQIRSTDQVRKAVDNLLTVGGSMFSPLNVDNFDQSMSQYGKNVRKMQLRHKSIISAFGQIVTIINRKARKTQRPLHSTTDNEHMTIVNHLKRRGYGVGHLPKQPKFD